MTLHHCSNYPMGGAHLSAQVNPGPDFFWPGGVFQLFCSFRRRNVFECNRNRQKTSLECRQTSSLQVILGCELQSVVLQEISHQTWLTC